MARRTSRCCRLSPEKGYPVSHVDCANDFLERIRIQIPRLAIIDCGVPDSFETLKHIRRDARLRSAPVVMFSIDAENLERKALLMGASAYVPKGLLDWAELLEQVIRFAGPPPESGPR